MSTVDSFLFSIVFWDISMPLVESMLLSLLLSTKINVYDRNVVNKYGLYLLLGVIIYNLIDYIYIYMCVCALSIKNLNLANGAYAIAINQGCNNSH